MASLDPEQVITELRSQVSSLEAKVEELTDQLKTLQDHTSEEKRFDRVEVALNGVVLQIDPDLVPRIGAFQENFAPELQRVTLSDYHLHDVKKIIRLMERKEGAGFQNLPLYRDFKVDPQFIPYSEDLYLFLKYQVPPPPGPKLQIRLTQGLEVVQKVEVHPTHGELKLRPGIQIFYLDLPRRQVHMPARQEIIPELDTEQSVWVVMFTNLQSKEIRDALEGHLELLEVDAKYRNRLLKMIQQEHRYRN